MSLGHENRNIDALHNYLLLLSFLYLNSVKILKYIKFTYKFKLIKGKAWFLQYKPALFTPNLKND